MIRQIPIWLIVLSSCSPSTSEHADIEAEISTPRKFTAYCQPNSSIISEFRDGFSIDMDLDAKQFLIGDRDPMPIDFKLLDNRVAQFIDWKGNISNSPAHERERYDLQRNEFSRSSSASGAMHMQDEFTAKCERRAARLGFMRGNIVAKNQ